MPVAQRAPTYRVAVNPPFADGLERLTAVVAAPLAGDYHVPSYRTTLSLKTAPRGEVAYATRRTRYRIEPGSLLVLNQGQEYTLDIRARDRAATLCVFFEPGFVEEVARSMSAEECALLDPDPEPARPGSLEIAERLHPKEGTMRRTLATIEDRVARGRAEPHWLEAQMFVLAAEIVRLDGRARQEMAGFPGLRASTRSEAYRRLHWARDFLDASFAEPLTVALVAKVASMSPYHFQRLFKLAFGETPMQRVQRLRLERAGRLLVETDRAVSRVCLDVGWGSLGTFGTVFRRRFGVSPSAFRQMRRIEEARGAARS